MIQESTHLKILKGKKAAGEPNTSYMHLAEKHGAKLVTYDNATNDQYLSGCSKWSNRCYSKMIIICKKMAVSAFTRYPCKNTRRTFISIENESGFIEKKEMML